MTGAACADLSELLDVEVHEFARTLALIAVGRFGWLKPGAFAKPDPLEHGRDRGERHPEELSDLGCGHI
jgi:hypothetical protein